MKNIYNNSDFDWELFYKTYSADYLPQPSLGDYFRNIGKAVFQIPSDCFEFVMNGAALLAYFLLLYFWWCLS